MDINFEMPAPPIKPQREGVQYWKESLPEIAKSFIEGNDALQKDPAQFVISSLNSQDDDPLFRKLIESFVPLRKPQLHHLVQMSNALGVPLSPVGLLTFTPGTLEKFVMRVTGHLKVGEKNKEGNDVEFRMGGISLPGTRFQTGQASLVGLWLYQSADAQARFSLDDLIATQPITQDPEPIPPTLSGSRDINEFCTHEAFHAVHSPLEVFVATTLDYEKSLLREALAYRTSLILGTRTKDQVRSQIGRYFINRTPKIDGQIDSAVDVISKSLDPEYQAQLSWQGIMAYSLEDFLNPPEDLVNRAKEMAEYARENVLGNYCEDLLSSK